MTHTRLILVGGFLGAGKTTLLQEASRRLAARGLRVGLITNDQAPDLVDTAFLETDNQHVREVSGSCFCCNLPGLLDAAAGLRREAHADVLLAEPVGSCTDLSATILQPLKDSLAGELVLSPLSVLVDPDRLELLLHRREKGLHSSALYIFRKQLEEADLIVISKADTRSASELAVLQEQALKFNPRAGVHILSTSTGRGVDAWLELVLTRSTAGERLAEVDYDIYAEGEAVLGWLNASIDLQAGCADWREYAAHLLETLGEKFDDRSAAVGHVKLLIQVGDGVLAGNLTGTRDTLSVRGPQLASGSARLTLNARVQMPPEELEHIVQAALAAAGAPAVSAIVRSWQCFSPARPNPTMRYDQVVRPDS